MRKYDAFTEKTTKRQQVSRVQRASLFPLLSTLCHVHKEPAHQLHMTSSSRIPSLSFCTAVNGSSCIQCDWHAWCHTCPEAWRSSCHAYGATNSVSVFMFDVAHVLDMTQTFRFRMLPSSSPPVDIGCAPLESLQPLTLLLHSCYCCCCYRCRKPPVAAVQTSINVQSQALG